MIEPDFVRRGVGDVAGVSFAPLFGRHALLDVAHREPEKIVNGAHPFGVAAGQVIIDGHDVNALPGLRVPDDGGNGGQRLTLASLHLGDLARCQRQRALELDIEHVELQHPRRYNRRDRDNFEQICRRSAGPLLQFVVTQYGQLRATLIYKWNL